MQTVRQNMVSAPPRSAENLPHLQNHLLEYAKERKQKRTSDTHFWILIAVLLSTSTVSLPWMAYFDENQRRADKGRIQRILRKASFIREQTGLNFSDMYEAWEFSDSYKTTYNRSQPATRK
jgi:hypothetical protein